jgi:enoyl-CoA hydratase/carnithine racemase
MNNAPVNALSPAFLAAIKDRLEAANANAAISAIVLTSGLRVFSAGGDAAWMGRVLAEVGPDGLVDRFNEAMDAFRDLCIALRRSRLLVVAALNGHTLAGGLELAVACDLRFCADHEKIQIGAPEMDLFGAMPSGGGGAQFMARLMGASRALEFIIEAKSVGPKRAHELGLVDRLYPTDEVIAQAQAFAEAAAKKAGPVGLAAAKRAILGGAELPLQEALEFDRSVHWDAMRRGGFRAGAAAFAKRFG